MSNQITIRFSESELAKFDELAREAGVNRSVIVRALIAAGLHNRAEQDYAADAAKDKKLVSDALLVNIQTLGLVRELATKAGVDLERSRAEARGYHLKLTGGLES